MAEVLCKIFLKVFHRALGLPLFSAMTVEQCLHLDCSSRKLQRLTAARYLLRLIAELLLRHNWSHLRFRRFAERMSEFTKPLSGCTGAIFLFIGACLSRMPCRVLKYW